MKSGDVSGILAVSVVAVDDAGEVLVLVVAGSSELEHQVADRDEGHGHEESGLSPYQSTVSCRLVLSSQDTYSELLFFGVLDAAGGWGLVVGVAFCLLTSDCARSLRCASSEGLHDVLCVQGQLFC